MHILIGAKILLVIYLFVYWFIIYPAELKAESEGRDLYDLTDDDDD